MKMVPEFQSFRNSGPAGVYQSENLWKFTNSGTSLQSEKKQETSSRKIFPVETLPVAPAEWRPKITVQVIRKKMAISAIPFLATASSLQEVNKLF